MKKTNDNVELEKAKIHIVVEIIEYMANAVVSKTIIKKTASISRGCFCLLLGVYLIP
jgi:hypothetical protein